MRKQIDQLLLVKEALVKLRQPPARRMFRIAMSITINIKQVKPLTNHPRGTVQIHLRDVLEVRKTDVAADALRLERHDKTAQMRRPLVAVEMLEERIAEEYCARVWCETARLVQVGDIIGSACGSAIDVYEARQPILPASEMDLNVSSGLETR